MSTRQDTFGIVKTQNYNNLNGKDVNSDGEFLIWCSRKRQIKECVATGISKSWLLTAKTLFPQDVDIHFEAYEIEKIRKNVKEAAKCFSTLVLEFVNEACVRKEIEAVTDALQASDMSCNVVHSTEQEFLKDMFYSLPSDVQHRLLHLRASQSEDTMDHCRFMLLLLTKFPSTTVPKHGIDLMETLITAEKKTLQQSPVNCYRKLLVCNLTPLLVNTDLPQKHILRLLMKSFEFYICYLTTGPSVMTDLPENESKIENPWKSLFYIYEKCASKLGWELSNLFGESWTKETAWQKITRFIHLRPDLLTNEGLCKQTVYGINLLFLHSLHEYIEKIYEGHMILVEIPLDVYNTSSSAEPPAKRLKVKIEDDMILTCQNRQVPINTFVCAFKCWDLFHSADPFEREFVKATQNLKIENWVNRFLQAVYLYKGLYKECLMNISYNEEILKKHIHLITIYFWLEKYLPMLEEVIEVIQQLNQVNNSVIQGSSSDEEIPVGSPAQNSRIRHLNFLYLNKENILKYITKLMIVALKKSAEAKGDICSSDGHILVFLQLNWPAEKHIFEEIIERIRKNQRFNYPLFMTYIVNMQMLEEFMYLASDASAGITLDITVPTNNQLINQRRMSTRGIDKGAKEDFKMSMKRQTGRAGENVYSLIMNFITTEKDHLLNAFSSTT